MNKFNNFVNKGKQFYVKECVEPVDTPKSTIPFAANFEYGDHPLHFYDTKNMSMYERMDFFLTKLRNRETHEQYIEKTNYPKERKIRLLKDINDWWSSRWRWPKG